MITAAYIDEFDYAVPWIQQALTHLSSERIRKVERFRHDEDKVRSIVGELLVRIVLQEVWGIPDEEIRFRRNAYGKPFLVRSSASRHPEIYFNISHAGNWVVVAVDHAPLGLDVEKMHVRDYDCSVIERFFSRREQLHIAHKPDAGRLLTFYQIWTLKESYSKAIGRGLARSMDSYSLILAGDKVLLHDDADYAAAQKWQLRLYDDLDGYMLALCYAPGAIATVTAPEMQVRPDAAPTLQRLTLTQVRNKFETLYR
jgi:4'-phosphopantetheinyl transferase